MQLRPRGRDPAPSSAVAAGPPRWNSSAPDRSAGRQSVRVLADGPQRVEERLLDAAAAVMPRDLVLGLHGDLPWFRPILSQRGQKVFATASARLFASARAWVSTSGPNRVFSTVIAVMSVTPMKRSHISIYGRWKSKPAAGVKAEGP